MSLAAAAQTLNAPEALVKRSAEARAKATGMSVDDILTAWAGGGTAVSPTLVAPTPVAAAPPETTVPPAMASVDTPAPVTVTPMVAPAPSTPERSASRLQTPPIITDRDQNPFVPMIGAAAVMFITLLTGLFAPAEPPAGNGVRSSAIPYSQEAVAGRDIYLAENCASCHTQQVRPIAADAGANEKVTLADSNQVLGWRRLGPDLSNVGARNESSDAFVTLVEGVINHPSYTFSPAELAALVAYLQESH